MLISLTKLRIKLIGIPYGISNSNSQIIRGVEYFYAVEFAVFYIERAISRLKTINFLTSYDSVLIDKIKAVGVIFLLY